MIIMSSYVPHVTTHVIHVHRVEHQINVPAVQLELIEVITCLLVHVIKVFMILL